MLRVGDRLALAAADLQPGRDARLTVEAVLESGVTVRFDARLKAPPMHP